MQGVCTWPHACCFGICKILNACSYLVSFYRGDLYLEGLICMFTLWSKYYGIYNRKQKLKVFLQCLVISIFFDCAIFLYLFNVNK